MNLIISTMLQEKQRIDYMLAKYQELLDNLPKGMVSEKLVNGNTYYYLKYRDGKKVVSKYIVKKDVESLQHQIAKRRHVETMIKSLQREQQLAEKVLEGNIWSYITEVLIAFAECSVLRFDAPDEVWLDFVSENRSGNYDGQDYDLVYGPVANDDVYTTFALYSAGVLTKEQTLEALKVKKLYNQLVLRSEKALSYLKFVGTVQRGEQ